LREKGGDPSVAKRSGHDDYSGIWGNPFYDDHAKEIASFDFVHKEFAPKPGLVSPASDAGGTVIEPYSGQPFDPEEKRLVQGVWDHEHCGVCFYSIGEGETYWENTDHFILCDACYDHYVRRRGATPRG
jgi:hypothetical protein